jgi:hypothetical protein
LPHARRRTGDADHVSGWVAVTVPGWTRERMPIALEFLEVAQPMRAYALVGSYLQSWGFMEGQLNSAIGNVLGLSLIPEAIVSRNVQFRDKLNIIKTALGLQGHFTDEERKRYLKLIKTISDRSADRNLIAHEWFCADSDGDGVKFSIVKAKGKFELPDTRWTVADFVTKCDELNDFFLGLVALEEQLKMFKNRTADPALLGLIEGLGASTDDQNEEARPPGPGRDGHGSGD